MKSVTYCGPEDPRDRTTRYQLGEHLLPKGVAVDVPEEVAAELEAIEGHTFKVADGGPRQVSKRARELAEEKHFNLDSIPGGGPIGVEDVRAGIEAVEQAEAASN